MGHKPGSEGVAGMVGFIVLIQNKDTLIDSTSSMKELT